MMLINTLLSYATDEHWDDLTSELERLNIRKAVTVRPTSFYISSSSPVPSSPPPSYSSILFVQRIDLP